MGTFKKIVFTLFFILIIGGVGAIAAVAGYYYGRDEGKDMSDAEHINDVEEREAELEKEFAEEKNELREDHEEEVNELQAEIDDLEKRIGSNTLERLQGSN